MSAWWSQRGHALALLRNVESETPSSAGGGLAVARTDGTVRVMKTELSIIEARQLIRDLGSANHIAAIYAAGFTPGQLVKKPRGRKVYEVTGAILGGPGGNVLEVFVDGKTTHIPAEGVIDAD